MQIYVFENWSKTFKCKPKRYFQPSSEQEIIEIIQLARNNNEKIRVVGSGHSPSDLACTNGYMINLDKMNRVLEINKDSLVVKVEAGIRLKQLHEILHDNGLAMSNLGIAGAISTATHGTGIDFGTLSSMINRLWLIDGNARILEISETENIQYFKASLCSLGALGIITRVELKVEKSFKLKSEKFVIKFDQMIDQWENLAYSAEHCRFWWYPYTDDVLVWRANRTFENETTSNYSFFRERIIGYYMLEFLYFISIFIPSLVPWINKTYLDNLQNFLKQRKSNRLEVDESWKVFNFDCLFKQYVTEWSLGWKKAPIALTELKDIIEKDESSSGRLIRAHFPVEIRFVKNEDIWLSPAYGSEPVCYIGIIVYRPYEIDPFDKKTYWNFFETLMQKYRGRPHWAKYHPLDFHQLKLIYPKLDDFMIIRRELDPDNLFENDYIKRHFYSSKL